MAEPRPHIDPDAEVPTAQMASVDEAVVSGPPVRPVRLFGSHAFFRLWLAQVVSALGDWIGFVAIVSVAQRVGGGSGDTAVGFVMIARMVPGFFLAPVAGVLVDRWNRKRVMISCDVTRAAVLATVPFIDTVWGLVVASLLLEIPTLMWSPAKEASVPNLVRPDYLTTANSLSLVAAYGTFPIAAALFAFLAKVVDWLSGIDMLDFLEFNNESVPLYFDVATFLLSALMIWTLPLKQRRPERAHREGRRIDLGGAFHDLKEGWRFIAIDPTVRAVIVGLSIGLAGGGMLVPLGPVFSRQILGAGSVGFGLLLTALGTGVAVGVVLLSAVQKRLPKMVVFNAALFAAGAFLAVATMTSTLTAVFACIVGLGVCAGAVYVLGFTILQETVEDEFRGRIFSALYTLVRLCLLLAFAVAPFLSRLLDEVSDDFIGRSVEILGFDVYLPGVRLTLLFSGALMVGAGFLALLSLRAGGRRRTSLSA